MPAPSESMPAPWIRVLAAVAGVVVLAAAIVLSNERPAAATGLEAFGSCAELERHVASAEADQGYSRLEASEDSATSAEGGETPASAASEAQSGGDDGTNTQVTGVDELDLVELLEDGRSLVAREDRVLLVSADGRRILAELATGPSPQISYDDDQGTVWAVSTDWMTTTLTRARLDGDAFVAVSGWSVAGRLVDLRRDGATVHLVAVDDDVMPVEPGIGGSDTDDAGVPFAGTSPVPCDEVLHSPLPGGAATTLVASFRAEGELAPTAATEIVGAGDNVLVTGSALYVSTPTYDGEQPVTGIHRFDVDGLALTGSGSIQGRLLNQFSLDEHDGHLRAAVTVGDGWMVTPMPVEGGPVLEDDTEVRSEATREAAPFIGPAQDPPTTDTTEVPPTTVEPPTTESTTTTTEATTTTTEATTTTEETTTTEATTTTAAPSPTDGLNEIVVFDLDGSLDVVGRTPRFGHPGETLHGIRFAGDVAYAVTFLQTDPFYVVDLTQPASPAVLGELEIPGFSAYLHPISPTQVIGFGPGPEGGVLARLFDVTDPAAPALLDTIRIADDSPIVWDHHALRTDGDRLLVAANDWVMERPARCGPLAEDEAALDAIYRQLEEAYQQVERQGGGAIPPELEALERQAAALSECVYPNGHPQARIVVLEPQGGRLGVTSVATGAGEAQRVLPLGDGGYLVVGSEVARVSASGALDTVVA